MAVFFVAPRPDSVARCRGEQAVAIRFRLHSLINNRADPAGHLQPSFKTHRQKQVDKAWARYIALIYYDVLSMGLVSLFRSCLSIIPLVILKGFMQYVLLHCNWQRRNICSVMEHFFRLSSHCFTLIISFMGSSIIMFHKKVFCTSGEPNPGMEGSVTFKLSGSQYEIQGYLSLAYANNMKGR